jgi:hypothetical protein
MRTFRRHWIDEKEQHALEIRPLRVVSRTARGRPRWAPLYLSLALVGVIGTISHFLVHGAGALEAADSSFALVLFAVLVAWVQVNKHTLARFEEPEAGTGRPHVRIVRSRPTRATAASDEADDRVILPYDFR